MNVGYRRCPVDITEFRHRSLSYHRPTQVRLERDDDAESLQRAKIGSMEGVQGLLDLLKTCKPLVSESIELLLPTPLTGHMRTMNPNKC